MSWLNRWNKRNQAAAEAANRLYKIVSGPTGSRYEIEATDALVDTVGAPPMVDLILMVRAFVRRRRGEAWLVTVRAAGESSSPALTRRVATKAEAESLVEELAAGIRLGGIEAT